MTAGPSLDLAGRPTVRVERRYPHPVEKVWQAVTEPEHLGAWFPSPVEVDLRPGGAMHFPALAGGRAAAGRVHSVAPPRLLRFTWDTDELAFELFPDGDGTVLVLTHTFDEVPVAASLASGWETCLVALRHVLADEPLPEPDRAIERHEELVRLFGLDRPQVTTTEDGWTVRFDRQLTCPAQVAWDLWFGRDRETGEQRSAPAVGEELRPYGAPDVVIGTMTEVDEPRVMAFTVGPTGGPGDHVRVELRDGTGHGARLVLTVDGSAPAEMRAAVEEWGGGAVAHLAREGARWALSSARPARAAAP